MTKDRIYLDYNATTPVDPEVLEAMLPYFHEMPGNAASRNHPFGWEAEEAVSHARSTIASILQIEEKEIVFTSGATESINLALKGVFELYHRKGNHLITVKTEHNAVLDTCHAIEKQGGRVTYLDVDENGLIDLEELAKAITPETILVSVMWANNETGVIQPIQEIGEICASKGVIFMSDATQAVGKIPVFPKNNQVHLLAFSAHKMYGPKGAGALYVSNKDPRIKLAPQIHGGGHESGYRSGTLNVTGIVGLGKALEIADASMEKEAARLGQLRDQLEGGLQANVEEMKINGKGAARLPHVSNLSFRYVEAEALMNTFNQKIAASTGSACSSASLEPSHVLTAMGLDEYDVKGSVRFSLGRFTQSADILTTIELVSQGIQQLRAHNPVWEMHQEGLI